MPLWPCYHYTITIYEIYFDTGTLFAMNKTNTLIKGDIMTEGQKKLNGEIIWVNETVAEMTAIGGRCDTLYNEICRPVKSFPVWLFDGLTGKGWEVKS